MSKHLFKPTKEKGFCKVYAYTGEGCYDKNKYSNQAGSKDYKHSSFNNAKGKMLTGFYGDYCTGLDGKNYGSECSVGTNC